jgi:hypothetical protein
MSRLWRGSDDLEERLRAHRAEPRPEFVHALVGRLERSRRRLTFRVAFASALTVVGLVAFGAAGGVGYASSAANSLVSSITSQGNGKGHDNPGQGNGHNTTTTTTTTPTTAAPTSTNSSNGNGNSGSNGHGNNASNNDVSNNSTPADDQYKPGCGAGDKNHTHTGPPGQVAKGNAGPGNPCPPFP